MSEKIDCAVIGAGVVGLAIARQLAMAGRDVLIIEQADAIGTVTSARNSEVIHAGIYYPKDSLKAVLCVQGRNLLYGYLEERGIDHERCGKLIVASGETQISKLHALDLKARANGIDDLQFLSSEDVNALEPELSCLAALLSPSTGIIDSHGYMLSLLGDAENNGATLACLSTVTGGEITERGIALDVACDGENMTLECTTVINSAGLGAQAIAASLRGMPQSLVPRLYLAKGNYFNLSGTAPFRHLVYPMPEEAGLGIHYTRDLGGQGRFGPDVEWVEVIDYDVDAKRGESFYAAIRNYWPQLQDDALNPAYSGMRPKIQAPGEDAADFIIQDAVTHGVRGLVNLYGIESPGLTASLAIAREVEKRLC